jgi:hypothetical protein
MSSTLIIKDDTALFVYGALVKVLAKGMREVPAPLHECNTIDHT